MGDLKNPRVIYLKGGLFVLLGLLAATGILLELPSWRTALLLALTIWAFARAYYFAFYVIEHYLDPGYRYAGLGSFVKYCWTKQRPRDTTVESDIHDVE